MRQAIVGVAVFLAGCKVSCSAGGDKLVSRATLEKQIQTWLDQIDVVLAKISCPEPMPPKVGASSTCSVEVDGDRHEVVVTITSVTKDEWNGDVAWKGGESVVNIAKLEEQLEAGFVEQFGERVDVECGSKQLGFLGKDHSATCELTAGATKSKVTITFDDKVQPVSFKYVPRLIGRRKIEEALTPAVREKLSSPGTMLRCGDEPIFALPATGIVACRANDGKRDRSVEITIDDDLTLKDWRLVDR